MIGGCEQLPGSEYKARDVVCTPEGMSLDMADAYGNEAGVQHCRRRLCLTAEGLLLQDDIALNEPQPVTWVFMLREKPQIEPACLKAGNVRMSFNAELTAAVEEIPITDTRMAGSFLGSLWRLTLTETAAKVHCRTFLMERNDEYE